MRIPGPVGARLRPATAAAEESSPSFERVVFFSDAVFAIVITLLVLPLTVDVELPEGEGGVAGQVLGLWPRAMTFVISFLVIGRFWVAHHRMFGYVTRHDQGLIWLNLVTLLTVSFLPFPSAVLGAHPTATESFPVVFYAASMTTSSIVLTGMWLYARARGLVDPGADPAEVHLFTIRSLVTSAIFLISVGAAFFGLWTAVLFWMVVLPVARALLPRTGAGRPLSRG